MIFNHICVNCQSAGVCKIADILNKFDEEAKRPLGVDIAMESCEHFLPIEQTDKE